MVRPQEGQDEAEDARVHDQPCAIRLVVPAGLGRLVGAAPACTDDVTDVHGPPAVTP